MTIAMMIECMAGKSAAIEVKKIVKRSYYNLAMFVPQKIINIYKNPYKIL